MTVPTAEVSPETPSPERLRYPLEFLTYVEALIPLLEQSRDPNRSTTDFTFPMSSAYRLPLDIEKRYPRHLFTSVNVSVTVSDEVIATGVDLTLPDRVLHLNRDLHMPDLSAEDYISSEDMPEKDDDILRFPRVPNPQINDFLFSLLGLDKVWAERRYMGIALPDEPVHGERMIEGLARNATHILRNEGYDFLTDSIVSIWITHEGAPEAQRLVSFVMHYVDYDQRHLSVELDLQSGIDVRFEQTERNGDSTKLIPTKIDYLIAMRVIRELIAALRKKIPDTIPLETIDEQDLPFSNFD